MVLVDKSEVVARGELNPGVSHGAKTLGSTGTLAATRGGNFGDDFMIRI